MLKPHPIVSNTQKQIAFSPQSLRAMLGECGEIYTALEMMGKISLVRWFRKITGIIYNKNTRFICTFNDSYSNLYIWDLTFLLIYFKIPDRIVYMQIQIAFTPWSLHWKMKDWTLDWSGTFIPTFCTSTCMCYFGAGSLDSYL